MCSKFGLLLWTLGESQDGNRAKEIKREKRRKKYWEIFILPPANYCAYEASPDDLVTPLKLHCLLISLPFIFCDSHCYLPAFWSSALCCSILREGGECYAGKKQPLLFPCVHSLVTLPAVLPTFLNVTYKQSWHSAARDDLCCRRYCRLHILREQIAHTESVEQNFWENCTSHPWRNSSIKICFPLDWG